MYKFIILISIMAMLMVGCSNGDVTNSQSESESVQGDGTHQKEAEPSSYDTNQYADVRMELVPEKTDDKKMTIRLINDSDEPISFGDWYVIEVCEDSVWYKMETKTEIDFELLLYTIEPHQSKEVSVVYTTLYELEDGKQYRIVKEIKVGEEKYYISCEMR